MTGEWRTQGDGILEGISISLAIEILTKYKRYILPGLAPNEEKAVQLGIEALKLIPKLRTEEHPLTKKPLPGETED